MKSEVLAILQNGIRRKNHLGWFGSSESFCFFKSVIWKIFAKWGHHANGSIATLQSEIQQRIIDWSN
jgi:hypothetical protein